LVIYIAFIAAQTVRHREYFITNSNEPVNKSENVSNQTKQSVSYK